MWQLIEQGLVPDLYGKFTMYLFQFFLHMGYFDCGNVVSGPRK